MKQYVQLFLDRGVLVNSIVGKYGNAPAAAAKGGWKEIVEILLNRDANVNQAGGRYGTPLQAAYCGRRLGFAHLKAVIQTIIDRGAEVNTNGVGNMDRHCRLRHTIIGSMCVCCWSTELTQMLQEESLGCL